jgi:hypothetical protein
VTGVPFRVETAGPFAHEPGRRVLAVGRTRGQGALVQTRARWGDITATGRRPDPAADDALAGELAGALAEQRAAGPVVRAGRDAWQRRDEAS